jgi:hypothetical protein
MTYHERLQGPDLPFGSDGARSRVALPAHPRPLRLSRRYAVRRSLESTTSLPDDAGEQSWNGVLEQAVMG